MAAGRIEFRDVWFTYQKLTAEQLERVQILSEDELGRSHDIEWILRGVSFTVEPDATAAIVGHTGAGKTTITALMMRFYDVQRGAVLVDGVDVREQDLRKLRRRFGVVLQDPFLFSGTISQNIRLGSNWITEDEVAHAAEEVNVADFIRTLPQGFAEPVLERGSTLSTGQKQLISFARALAHRPGILILDEATSSVDTETEIRRAARTGAHDHGTNVCADCASAVDNSAGGYDSGNAQGQAARTGDAPGAPGHAWALLQAVSAAV